MVDLLSSAVRLSRAALQPSVHTAEPKLPPPPKKKVSNYAPLRTLSRAFQGANNFVFSLWDGLTPGERERRRTTEERKTLLIFHMKNVGTDLFSCVPRVLPRGVYLDRSRTALPIFQSSTNMLGSNRPTASNNGRQQRSSSTRSRATTNGSSI